MNEQVTLLELVADDINNMKQYVLRLRSAIKSVTDEGMGIDPKLEDEVNDFIRDINTTIQRYNDRAYELTNKTEGN